MKTEHTLHRQAESPASGCGEGVRRQVMGNLRTTVLGLRHLSYSLVTFIIEPRATWLERTSSHTLGHSVSPYIPKPHRQDPESMFTVLP